MILTTKNHTAEISYLEMIKLESRPLQVKSAAQKFFELLETRAILGYWFIGFDVPFKDKLGKTITLDANNTNLDYPVFSEGTAQRFKFISIHETERLPHIDPDCVRKVCVMVSHTRKERPEFVTSVPNGKLRRSAMNYRAKRSTKKKGHSFAYPSSSYTFEHYNFKVCERGIVVASFYFLTR